MRTRVQGFPFASEFASSSLLIVCVNDGDIVALCGIRGLLNTLVLYVREGYRSRGIGLQILSQSVEAARKRKLDFVTLSVSSDNTIAFRLYKRVGFSEVLSLSRSSQILMMLPLTCAGELMFQVFRFARLALPSMLLFHIHMWLYKRTL